MYGRLSPLRLEVKALFGELESSSGGGKSKSSGRRRGFAPLPVLLEIAVDAPPVTALRSLSGLAQNIKHSPHTREARRRLTAVQKTQIQYGDRSEAVVELVMVGFTVTSLAVLEA